MGSDLVGAEATYMSLEPRSLFSGPAAMFASVRRECDLLASVTDLVEAV